jgi:general secretion pathway protein B
MRLRSLQWLLAAIAQGSALAAVAQVTPAEPFGGRPFSGGPGGAQAAAPRQPAPAAAPQSAPVVVQPGAAPVVVQGAPAQVVVQPPPAAPPPATAQMGAGPITRPSSSVSPQPPQTMVPGGAPQGSAVQAPPQGVATVPAPAPAPAPQAAPAPVTPPFSANNRNAPRDAPQAAASQQQQQPVKGLPPDAPRLVISGSVWSADPARRLLIVNGQPVREGADVGPGVVVEQVQRDAAVLGFRGSTYTVFF